jgi:hypothetical protein
MRSFHLANVAAQGASGSGERGHMRRNRPKPHVTFQARISTEAEKLRQKLRKQYSGESNGKLLERAFRKLACPADEQPEAAA